MTSKTVRKGAAFFVAVITPNMNKFVAYDVFCPVSGRSGEQTKTSLAQSRWMLISSG